MKLQLGLILRIFLGFCLIFLMSGAASAENLPETAEQIVEAAQEEEGYALNKGISALLQQAADLLPAALRFGAVCGAKLLMIALLVAIVSHLGIEQAPAGSLTLTAAAALCVVLVGSSDMSGILGMGRQFIEDLNVFSKALMPTLTAASAAAGAPAAALARQTVVMLLSDFITTVVAGVFLPLVYGIMALKTVGMVSENPLFPRLAAGLRQLLLLSLRYTLVLYFGYLSLSGIIGGAADTLARKAAKTAITTGVPVVGGMLSEAADSVFAGAAMARNTIGVFGVLGVLGLALLPLLYTGINYLTLRLVSALSAAVSEKTAAAIDILADAMSLIFAMIATIAAMLLVTLVTSMRTAGL